MSDTSSSAAAPSFLKRHRLAVMIAVPAVVIVVAVWLWLTGGRYATTDNAFVQTGRVQISANASGHVVELRVHDNQRVRKGDILFRLDSDTQQAQADLAAAQLTSAQAQVVGFDALYRQRQAELAAAQLALNYRRRDLARDRGLAASGVVSRQEVDDAAHELEVAAQEVATARGQLAVAAANLGPGGPANPAVRQARANLNRALVSSDQTIVRAPQDGVVTRVSQLQVGSYVQAAQPVFSLITDEIWVEANFKENDLAHMRPGQRAWVKIDAHPDLDLEARVQSISPGTGSSFSLLPPENATGNWVKVVQRVPVRLVFAKAPPIPLQGGLSSEVKIDTRHRRIGGDAPQP